MGNKEEITNLRYILLELLDFKDKSQGFQAKKFLSIIRDQRNN